jgi:putative DNA methylase
MGSLTDECMRGTKLARGANFRCILSDTPIEPKYIKAEGMAGRMGTRLLAIVADGPRGRLYLEASPEAEALAKNAAPTWRPELRTGNWSP